MTALDNSKGAWLTIAIPTYNRARFLKRLLDALAPQLRNEPRVELIISDNAATDETPEVVRSFESAGLPLRYLRNESNIGFDRNILQCFEQASGQYIWIVGDDDVPVPPVVERVLAALEQHPSDLLFIRPYAFSKDYEAERPVEKGVEQTLLVDDWKQFATIANTRSDLVFISSLVVNKRRVMESNPPAFTAYEGTHMLQMSWVLTALKNFRRGILINERLIAGMVDNPTGGFDAAVVFGKNYTMIMDSVLGPSHPITRTLTNHFLMFWAPNWVEFRTRATNISLSHPDKVLRPIMGSNVRYWIFAFPLMKLPIPLARVWRFAVLVFRVFRRWLSTMGTTRMETLRSTESAESHS